MVKDFNILYVSYLYNKPSSGYVMEDSKEDYNSPSTFVPAIEIKPDVIELALKLSRIRLG